MARIILFVVLATAPFVAAGGDCSVARPEAFESFFKRFSSDSEFATTRTVFPLEVLVWEYGLDANSKDASAPKRTNIARVDYSQRPSLASYMEGNGLSSRNRTRGPRSVVVDLFKEGTDWLESYYFRMQKGCWALWKFENRSL